MADISKINVNGVDYNIKDEVARSLKSVVSTEWAITRREVEVTDEYGTPTYKAVYFINNKEVHVRMKEGEFEGAYICLAGEGDGIGSVEPLVGGAAPFHCLFTSISKEFDNYDPENPVTYYTEELDYKFMTSTFPVNEYQVNIPEYDTVRDFILNDGVKIDYSQPTILVMDNPNAPGFYYGPHGKWLTIPSDLYDILFKDLPINLDDEQKKVRVTGINI